MAGPALQPYVLAGGLTILGVVLGQVVQHLATARRDRQQAIVAENERLAGWRVEAYRDVSIWVKDAIEAFLLRKDDAPPALDDQLVAQVDLVGSPKVRASFDAIYLASYKMQDLRVEIQDEQSGTDAMAGLLAERRELRSQLHAQVRQLTDACRADLQGRRPAVGWVRRMASLLRDLVSRG